MIATIKHKRRRNPLRQRLTDIESDEDDDDNDDNDDNHDHDDDNEENKTHNDSLEEPLTAEERTIYTIRGIRVRIEFGRSKQELHHVIHGVYYKHLIIQHEELGQSITIMHCM